MTLLNQTLMLMLLSCGGVQHDSSSPCYGAEQVEWNYWARGFFDTYCRGCHSSTTVNRFGAPDNINFDSEAEVLSQANAIYDSVILRQSMPKGGGLEDKDMESLRVYLQCWGDVEHD
ncbi:MAG: hypothetical protein CMK59_05790 [Proteobacteria bacterium]|nr:hypothetical protein [Pseudomonadota bacterium]